MIQPGLFYSDYGVKRQTADDKLDNLYESVARQKIVKKNKNTEEY